MFPATWSSSWILLSVCIVATWAITRLVAQRKRNPRNLPLPPGPKGWPIVGNAFQMPKTKPWETYHAMCQEYGDLIYLNAMGQGVLLVGSKRRAVDLFENRSAIYSDRPAIAIQDLAEMNWNFGFMTYGPVWRKQRRIFVHDFVGRKMLDQWHPIMYEERDRLLSGLKIAPEALRGHLTSFSGTIITRVSYGFDDLEKNEELAQNSRSLVSLFGESRKPGKFLVNVIPALKYVPDWVPGAGFKTHFKTVAALSRKVLHDPFDEAKHHMKAGKRSALPSIAATMMDRLGVEDDEEGVELEGIAKAITAFAYFAGTDTIHAVAHALTLALIMKPEIQKKAQQEVDSVVGRERLPLISDRPHLPYCQAILKEASRWFTALPIATSRANREDDEYDGYFIPKGTLILPLSWTMMHDEDVFEKPFEFLPERFLKNGQIDHSVPDGTYAGFGYGRRICAGVNFTNDTLFIFLTGILATFDVSAPLDERGQPIPLQLELLNGAPVAPAAPFKCNITLRI